MADDDETNSLKDYLRNPQYERRVVVFMDVLGWRSQIARAGHDPTKLGKLRRYILQQTRIMRLDSIHRLRVTSFSDNVVLSQELSDRSWFLIQQLGAIISSAALGGLLVRGGITVGDLIHDDEVVFGPGLNRAYELESKIADVPRVIIDPNVEHEFGELPQNISEEGGYKFVDPFTVSFMRFVQEIRRKMPSDSKDLRSVGLPKFAEILTEMPPDLILQAIYDELRDQVRSPLEDKEYRKVAWLFDRIASRVGMSPAHSYPRVRPGELIT